MDDFIRKSLKPILDSEVDDEIIQYIKQIKVAEDFEEFIDNIIDRSNSKHIQMYEELKNKLFNSNKTPNNSRKTSATKNKFNDHLQNKNVNEKSVNVNDDLKSTRAIANVTAVQSNFAKMQVTDEQLNKHIKPKQITPKGQKQIKSVSNLRTPQQYYWSGNGKIFSYPEFELNKGRQPCDCEASYHQLINNCTDCGRIVCQLEGSGPCFTCSNMVATNGELEILELNSKESDKLYNRLKNQKLSVEWKKATEMRDKLLEADRTGDYTKLYDDQTDYFVGDKRNTETLKNLQKLRYHTNRKELKFALDYSTRLTTDNEYKKNKESLRRSLDKLLSTTEQRFPKNVYEEQPSVSNVNKNDKSLEEDAIVNDVDVASFRIANKALLAETDQGLCLTMHQPWASLLVSGIKLHEGRTWPTTHRGHLWIHAASRQPENEEILEIEKKYRIIYNDEEILFPKKYPISCLLGRVFVEDCLRQEEYRALYPQGESESPYVLICSLPMILPVFVPMQGGHKIYPLNKTIRQTVRSMIMSSKWV